MKKDRIISATIAGLILVALIGYATMKWRAELEAEGQVPSLTEIQEMVGAEPDGVYGPETKAKWDRAVFNQYAERHFTESGVPK